MTMALNTLYVQTQGTYLHLDHDTVSIDQEGSVQAQIPLQGLGSIVVFGNVLISPYLLSRCGMDGRGLVWLTKNGRFQARAEGPRSGNVLLRRAQYAAAGSDERTLSIASRFVAGKLQNARKVLQRAARETVNSTERETLTAAATLQATALARAKTATSLDALRGLEGEAASSYFAAFNAMIRTHDDAFTLNTRTRRPPRDPVNALLSFTYSMLANDCTSALESVGLDPQVGFLHALRPGRPALALDLMEEFRAVIADRLTLTLINRGQVKASDFTARPGGAVQLSDAGRKTVIAAYQKRKQEAIAHPSTSTTLSLALVLPVQARLLARTIRGDIETYPPFIPRA